MPTLLDMDFNLPIVVANIASGPDILILLGIVVLLFGGSQIPKIARSLGQASKEFKAGQEQTVQEQSSQGQVTSQPSKTDFASGPSKPSEPSKPGENS